MIRIFGDTPARYCDGVQRRSFLQLGMTGLAGSLGLPNLLRAVESSRPKFPGKKDTSVIFIWLNGGPSHMDMYDMKPQAPVEYRGIWSPIAANVPGMEVSELFPLQAKIADKFAVVRSLHHGSADHFTGSHILLTGKDGANGADRTGKHPFIGAAICKTVGSRRPNIPANVAIPYAASSAGDRPGFFSGHYLGKEFTPFDVDADPNVADFQVRGLSMLPELDLARLEDRRSLLSRFDAMRRDLDASGVIQSFDKFQTEAHQMVAGQRAIEAFDLSREDERRRDRYGRHTWGQSALLARRLVEAGSTFITVNCRGWDHHSGIQKGYHSFLPMIDQMVSALIEDLDDRGLLETTLVVMCGEFGRTPKMNGGDPALGRAPGRDHWGNAMSVFMAGGGVQGGRYVGSTDALGEGPKDRPLLAGDLHATIFQVLGIDPHIAFPDFAGRPTHVIEQGEVISELF